MTSETIFSINDRESVLVKDEEDWKMGTISEQEKFLATSLSLTEVYDFKTKNTYELKSKDTINSSSRNSQSWIQDFIFS